MSISHCVQRGLAPLFKLCIPLRQAYYHHPIVMQVWKSSTSWCLRVSLPPSQGLSQHLALTNGKNKIGVV